MPEYKVLNTPIFKSGNFSLVPIRFEDRYDIMKWRNEQIYHLRQSKPLTKEDQDAYFKNVVSKLFDQEKPSQILFSFLENDNCIGYGGLVHINWIDQNAEISFVMNTALEITYFQNYWLQYLLLIEKVAFLDLNLHKIFTYAFDLRPQLYSVLLSSNFVEEVRLKEHCYFEGLFLDVVIHSKINQNIRLYKATKNELKVTYKWASSENIRKYAFNQSEIWMDKHEKWFLGKINDKSCLYYILKKGQNPIGSIRLDIDKKNQGVISFLIDELYQGKGYGKKILELLELEMISLKKKNFKLIGYVLEQNISSIKTFHNLEYIEVENHNGVLKFEKIIL